MNHTGYNLVILIRNDWHVDPILKCDRIRQLTGECDGCFYLLKDEILIDMVIIILGSVSVRILIAMIILDLDGCDYSLRTEGAFIPSAAVGEDFRVKVQLVTSDDTR